MEFSMIELQWELWPVEKASGLNLDPPLPTFEPIDQFP
jgi:hypothetical protein